MKKSFLLFVSSLFSLSLFAQYKVRIVVQDKSPSKPDSIFLVGPLFRYTSDSVKYNLSASGNNYKSILLDLRKGKFEYTFFGNKGRFSYENIEIHNQIE